MLTVGLLSNEFFSNNLGVSALSVCNIILIEEACKLNKIDHEYIIFDHPQNRDKIANYLNSITELKNINFRIYNTLNLRKGIIALNQLKKDLQICDVIFDTSGGDSFSDIYGINRLLHQLICKHFVEKNKKPLILPPQTIGPFNSRIWRGISREVLKKSSLVFVRDNISYKYAKEELKLQQIFEVTDMAMILPYEHQIKEDLKKDRSMNVGLNISGLLYHGGYSKNNQFDLKINYHDLIIRIIELLTELKCQIYLIPHVITTGVESDNEVCGQLKEQFPQVIIPEPFNSPIEAKTYISKMDLFLGSRMHSTIASISTGVPVIPLSYSRKFEGLFGTLGYNRCIDLRNNDINNIIDTISSDIREYDDIKLEVKKSKDEIDRRILLYKTKLSKIMLEVNTTHE